jgi:adenine phosphoribosyltransferase
VRKKGKLPGETVQAAYVKEYGADIFEMQRGSLNSADRVVVVDDLIATGTQLKTLLIILGGSAKATGELVKQLGAQLLEYAFIMELTFLSGWKNLDAPVWRLVTEEASSKAGYVKTT